MNNKGLLSVKELASYLGVSKTVAYRLVHRDDFPVLHLGKRLLIPVADLTAWISNEANHSGK